jgi:hypothetical protein
MCAATVQQFLERYEVGQTIGVGGEYFGAARCLPDGLSYTGRLTMLLFFAGFSVVKAGTDKKTGACVAIKVSWPGSLLM